jgi:hypothetical protein
MANVVSSKSPVTARQSFEISIPAPLTIDSVWLTISLPIGPTTAPVTRHTADANNRAHMLNRANRIRQARSYNTRIRLDYFPAQNWG